MNEEELSQIEVLSIDINTDLCILKNAMTNPDDNTLVMDDLVDFVAKIYKTSDEMRNVFVNSLG
jgi:hypothetical protein